MKHFAKILCLYFVFLAITPCLDDCSIESCSIDGKDYVENSQKDSHCDFCSPLCICECCNTVVTSTSNYTFDFHINTEKIIYLEKSCSYFHTLPPASPPPKS